MKYKISDTPLKLREYGRNIQSMVEYLKTVEDREKRTQMAHEIVAIMSNLQPQLKEFPDYKQKLWDHLFVISDFELDVDSPYPIPDESIIAPSKDERMDYYTGKPSFRQYGHNIDLMVECACEMEEGESKKKFINLIANTMKQFLWNIDRETTPETVIAEHINEISKGRLKIKGEDLTIHKITTTRNTSTSRSNGSNNGKRGGRKGRKKKH
jgi:hypothetical protein